MVYDVKFVRLIIIIISLGSFFMPYSLQSGGVMGAKLTSKDHPSIIVIGEIHGLSDKEFDENFKAVFENYKNKKNFSDTTEIILERPKGRENYLEYLLGAEIKNCFFDVRDTFFREKLFPVYKKHMDTYAFLWKGDYPLRKKCNEHVMKKHEIFTSQDVSLDDIMQFKFVNELKVSSALDPIAYQADVRKFAQSCLKDIGIKTITDACQKYEKSLNVSSTMSNDSFIKILQRYEERIKSFMKPFITSGWEKEDLLSVGKNLETFYNCLIQEYADYGLLAEIFKKNSNNKELFLYAGSLHATALLDILTTECGFDVSVSCNYPPCLETLLKNQAPILTKKQCNQLLSIDSHKKTVMAASYDVRYLFILLMIMGLFQPVG